MGTTSLFTVPCSPALGDSTTLYDPYCALEPMTSATSFLPRDVPPQPRKRSLWSRLSVRQPMTAAQTSSLELLAQEEEEQWEKENSHDKAAGTPFFVSPPAVATRPPRITRSAHPSLASSPSASCSAALADDQPLPPSPSPGTLSPPPLPPRLPGYSSAPHRPVSPTTSAAADHRSRRKSLALSNWQASRATQAVPGGQESLEGLLDFLDSPSASPSATQRTAPPSPAPATETAGSQPLPVAESPPPMGRGASSEKAQRRERRKREKREKKMEKERRKNEEKNKKRAQKELPTKLSAEVHMAADQQAGTKSRGLFRRREARMTWSPQVAAETMSDSRGLFV